MVSESSSGTTAAPNADCNTSTAPTASGVRATGNAQMASSPPSAQIRSVATRDRRRSAVCEVSEDRSDVAVMEEVDAPQPASHSGSSVQSSGNCALLASAVVSLTLVSAISKV